MFWNTLTDQTQPLNATAGLVCMCVCVVQEELRCRQLELEVEGMSAKVAAAERYRSRLEAMLKEAKHQRGVLEVKLSFLFFGLSGDVT